MRLMSVRYYIIIPFSESYRVTRQHEFGPPHCTRSTTIPGSGVHAEWRGVFKPPPHKIFYFFHRIVSQLLQRENKNDKIGFQEIEDKNEAQTSIIIQINYGESRNRPVEFGHI